MSSKTLYFSVKSLIGKLLTYTSLVLISMLVLIWILFPVISKTLLNSYFKNHDAQIIVEHIEFNPFKGRLELHQVHTYQYNNETTGSKQAFLDSFIVDIAYWPLFNQTLVLEEFKLINADVTVNKTAKSLNLLGLTIPNSTTSAPIPKDESNTVKSPLDHWSLMAPTIDLQDVKVTFTRLSDDTTPIPLTDRVIINTFQLTDLQYAQQNLTGSLSFRSQLNQASVDIMTEFSQSPEQTTLNLNLNDLKIPTEAITNFIPKAYKLDGALQLQGSSDIQVNLNPLEVSLNGDGFKGVLSDVEVGIEDIQVAVASLNLQAQPLNIQWAQNGDTAIDTQLTMGIENASFVQKQTLNDTTLNIQSLLLESILDLAHRPSEHQIAITDLLFHAQGLEAFQAENAVKNENFVISTPSLKLLVQSETALTVALETIDINNTRFVATQANTKITNDAFALNLNNFDLNWNLLTSSLDRLQWQSQLSTQGIQLHQKEFNQNKAMNVNLGQLTFDNQGSITQNQQQTQITGDINTLDITDFMIDQTPLTMSLGNAQTQLNRIDLLLEDGQLRNASTTFQTTLSQLALKDRNQGTVFNSQKISLASTSLVRTAENFSVQTPNITLNNITLSEKNIPESKNQALPALAKIGQLSINAIDVNAQRANIDTIALQALDSHILLSATRELKNLLIPTFGDSDKAEENRSNTSSPTVQSNKETTTSDLSTTKAENSDAAFYLTLNEFSIGEGSTLFLSDQGITPNLQQTLNIDDFYARNINTQNKDQFSQVHLNARNGRYAKILLDANFQPMANKLTLQTRLSTEELELPPFSPYISDILGYEIESGQLDSQLTLDAQQGELVGNANLMLREFDLSGKKDYTRSKQAGAIPLNLAIDVLKDGKNNIELDIPLSGDIDNPEFKWGSFLMIPVRKAMYQASSTYMMQTFVPYANIISIAKIASEQLLRVRLEPLTFEPKQVVFDTPQQNYLDELSRLLQDKPDTQIKLCSIATPTDLVTTSSNDLTEAEKQALKDLAQLRVDNVKDFLVDQAGIASSRLLVCAPEIDSKESRAPRIEFTF